LQSQIEELDAEEITREITSGDLEELFIGTQVSTQGQLGPDAHSTATGDINVNVARPATKLPRLA